MRVPLPVIECEVSRSFFRKSTFRKRFTNIWICLMRVVVELLHFFSIPFHTILYEHTFWYWLLFNNIISHWISCAHLFYSEPEVVGAFSVSTTSEAQSPGRKAKHASFLITGFAETADQAENKLHKTTVALSQEIYQTKPSLLSVFPLPLIVSLTSSVMSLL